MKIIICGAHALTHALLQALSFEEDIVIIDNCEERLQKIKDIYDVQTIVGSPTHVHILERANIDKECALLALTDDDNQNLIIAHMGNFYTASTVAHVRDNPLLYKTIIDSFSLGAVFSTDIIMASKAAQCLYTPFLLDYAEFLHKMIALLGFKVHTKHAFIKQTWSEIKRVLWIDYKAKILYCLRENKIFFPEDQNTLIEGDYFYCICDIHTKKNLMRFLGYKNDTNGVVICGTSPVTLHMLDVMAKTERQIIIVEENSDNITKVALRYPQHTIIQAHPLHIHEKYHKFLSKMGHMVSMTSDDALNILSVLMGQHKYGIAHNMVFTNSIVPEPIWYKMGAQRIMHPSQQILSQIIPHIYHSFIVNFYSMEMHNVYFSEVRICKKSKALSLCVQDMESMGIHILCVMRHREIFWDMHTLVENDHMLVMFKTSLYAKFKKIFQPCV